VTTIARLLPDRDRQRLLERLRELRETARLMEERGSLAAPGPPVPLHRAGRDTERTTTS
jgi:hypothetical protein